MNPYIMFKDTAREAMEFYKAAFGGKLTMSTFKEAHASSGPEMDDKIMHAILEADNGIVLMASDSAEGNRDKARVSISLSGDNEPELRGYWDKLAAGGAIEQPLTAAPWGDTFGMFTDKFGIHWLLNITAKK